MPYRRKTDTNHQQVVLELRTAGYTVVDMSRVGNGIPDIILCAGQHCEWVEIKRSPRAALTEAESAFFAVCPGGEPILGWSAPLIIAEFERRRHA